MRIAFIPIDNRPVCYTMPQVICGISSDIEFFIPPRDLLGDLNKIAKINELYRWIEKLPELDAIVMSLDTLTYGGLIPSRRGPETLEQLQERISRLKTILESKNAKIYAVSSIMRISNNNFNEEEKPYWNEYGKKIFDYSYNMHKYGKPETDVPVSILKDYLNTRNRNFEINKTFLQWQKEGLFETLVFSKDDCAEYGLNVKEALTLEQLGGFIKTGADEIPLSLLSRALDKNIRICPVFIEPEYKNLISNYEDISVEKSVKSQIELAGCEICEKEDADVLLYVNNFKMHQGEIVMKKDTEAFSGIFKTPQKPYMIADVRFANGSDNSFVKELFKNKFEDNIFYGYSAWNTTANSLGSLICGAKYKFFAQNSNSYSQDEFRKLQITRFLDDWAYQANVRQELTEPNLFILRLKMHEYEKVISRVLGTDINVKYLYPWNRLFEVEIGFN